MVRLHLPFCLEALECRRLLSALWMNDTVGSLLRSPRHPFDAIAREVGSVAVVANEPWQRIPSPTSHVEGVLATFTGALSETDYAATIDWHDGSTSAGQVVRNVDGTFSVVGMHDYAVDDATQFCVAVQIDGVDGSRAYDETNAFVNFDTLTFTESAKIVCPLNPHRSAPNSFFIGSMFDSNANGHDGSAYIITVDWGDGKQSTGTAFTHLDGLHHLSGEHDYAQPGFYDVTVTVQRAPAEGELTIPIAIDRGAIEIRSWTDWLAQAEESFTTNLQSPQRLSNDDPGAANPQIESVTR